MCMIEKSTLSHLRKIVRLCTYAVWKDGGKGLSDSGVERVNDGKYLGLDEGL